eukprot:Blabericola_migrator_1__11435@NODE_679_length_6909_cov_149_679480_g493_i0_p3_GENE_NODE_679_length_6909_cov_149_679480_g493_i0NODE_679_length_6909_cov_149_679480_g493_i0_p3_ORF_typecomplete_len395_score60_99DNA_pol_lambd_f/PF10391_9/5_1e20DNA_pol_B_palm/PF14792_6/9_9e03DNA_pol_B_palm/PF14792_6/2e14HHH_8/PF14716_6/4_8e12HHH_5/PF14520_6/1_7e03HHH_5/PF14520_6/0_0062Suppressor_APC/PF11414_8/2_1e02Suppressor_APC/PF11414_8/0_18zfC2H2/PF00096_26/5_1e02zfC2H2/PF00096_26/21zfC2H2/PF00096_26/2_7e02_NODE_67
MCLVVDEGIMSKHNWQSILVGYLSRTTPWLRRACGDKIPIIAAGDIRLAARSQECLEKCIKHLDNTLVLSDDEDHCSQLHSGESFADDTSPENTPEYTSETLDQTPSPKVGQDGVTRDVGSTSKKRKQSTPRIPKTYQDETFNRDLESELRQLSDLYSHMKNEPWRQKAYRVAADIVRRLPFEIRVVSDVDRPELKRLGPKTKDKIREWLNTGGITKKRVLESDDKLQTVKLFMSVWGVGSSKAEAFYAQGFRTLDDLRQHQDLLNDNQKIGLKFVEDFNTKMPRSEVEEIASRVTAVNETLFGKGFIEVVIAGSYRRGALECGDCDLLAFKKKSEGLKDELDRWVGAMRREGFLIEDLIQTNARIADEVGGYSSVLASSACSATAIPIMASAD